MSSLILEKDEKTPIVIMIVSPILGIIVYRVLMLIRLSNSEIPKYQWMKYFLIAVLAPWKTDVFENLTYELFTGKEENALVEGQSSHWDSILNDDGFETKKV